MELEQIVSLLMNNGAMIVILAYFMWRDKNFMVKLENTLATIEEFLKEVRK